MSRLEGYCILSRSTKAPQQQSQTSLNQITSEPYIQTLSCFNCAGKKPKINKCAQCSSTGFIYQNHALCDLINQVLCSKLKRSKTKIIKKLSIIPISQQSVEEKLQFCNKCEKQCQQNYLHCSRCPQINICKECIKSYKHLHQMVDIKIQKPLSSKKCSNCAVDIECRYEYCLICQKNSKSYLLCCECKSQMNFIHQHSEFHFSLMLDNKTMEKSKANNCRKQQEDMIIKISPCIYTPDKIIEQMNSPVNVSLLTVDDDNCSHIFKSSKIRPSITTLVESNYIQRREQINQSQIFVNYSFLQSSSKKIFQGNQENEIGSSHLNIRKIETQSQSDGEGYVFSGYNCDVCNILPIKKIRYRCKVCDDFDMCRKCYKSNQFEHQHQDFEMINGQQKRKKKIEKFKQIAQKSIARKQFR